MDGRGYAERCLVFGILVEGNVWVMMTSSDRWFCSLLSLYFNNIYQSTRSDYGLRPSLCCCVDQKLPALITFRVSRWIAKQLLRDDEGVSRGSTCKFSQRGDCKGPRGIWLRCPTRNF